MLSTSDILLNGINFRGKTISDGLQLTPYNISPRYIDQKTFVDFSSTTASQPSNIELDFFASIYHQYSGEEQILEKLYTNKKELSNTLEVETNKFVFTPSGTDCDAIISIISNKFKKPTHIINICPEETGRLTKRFQLLDIDREDISVEGITLLHNLVNKEYSENQNKIIYHNLPFRYNQNPPEYSFLINRLEKILQDIPDNEIILLRTVFCSKTGLCFPSIKDLAYLKNKMNENFHLIIDCCQSRITKKEFDALKELSSALFLSFSKFLQTPSFAGVSIFNNMIADVWQEIISCPQSNKEIFTFVVDYSIYKYLYESGKINFKLNSSYVSILARCELGINRLRSFWNLDNETLIKRLDGFNKLVEKYLGEIVVPIDNEFKSKISSSIRLLDLTYMGIPGNQIYEMISRFYYKKRVILGQPVFLNGNSNNLRVAAGYRIIADPNFSLDLLEENFDFVKSTFKAIFNIIKN